MRTDDAKLRAELIRTARGMNERGINVNKSGNVSARCHRGASEGYLITPTGVPYAELEPEDLVFMSLEEPRIFPFPPFTTWWPRRAAHRSM